MNWLRSLFARRMGMPTISLYARYSPHKGYQIDGPVRMKYTAPKRFAASFKINEDVDAYWISVDWPELGIRDRVTDFATPLFKGDRLTTTWQLNFEYAPQ